MDKKPHSERFDAGLKTRREVLGAEYVDKSMSTVDDFNREFQELLNTYCWNDIWNRPGLPRHTRSLLNLAMLTALGKGPELKLHIRGALNNGVSKDEIKEVFLQAAIYAGVPAAVEAFRTAREVFASSEDRGQKTEDRGLDAAVRYVSVECAAKPRQNFCPLSSVPCLLMPVL